MRRKFEIRRSTSETHSKFEIRMVETQGFHARFRKAAARFECSSRFPLFEFVSNVEFRISNVLWILFSVILAAPAHAHLMNTGFGPFYDGAAHLFVTPEDLLPVVALTLLGGLRGPRCGRTVLFVLPMVWLAASVAGGLLAPQLTPSAATAAVTAALTVALGVLVAADAPLSLALVAGLAISLGLINGGINGIELGRARASGVGAVGLAAAGIAGALFVVASLVGGHVASLRAPWARVVVRVAGSWIGAIGLLLLGWSVRSSA
jgi:hydrogenase/urease accessory protein HupE